MIPKEGESLAALMIFTKKIGDRVDRYLAHPTVQITPEQQNDFNQKNREFNVNKHYLSLFSQRKISECTEGEKMHCQAGLKVLIREEWHIYLPSPN